MELFMKLFIAMTALLASVYAFSGVTSASSQVSLKNGSHQTSLERIIPKRPPINDDGPGGGGPR